MATMYHIFSIFLIFFQILLPCDYAVRPGSKKKCTFYKSHGNTIFTDPTFDFFFRH